MKILQILNERLIHTKTKTVNVKSDLDRYHPWDFENAGLYSAVSQDKTDQTMIKKTARNVKKSAEDPYWAYVDLCIEHHDSNPYFPRIYKSVKFKDSKGQIIPRVVMEKLIHFNDVKLEEVKNVFQMMFDVEKFPGSFDDWEGYDIAQKLDNQITGGIAGHTTAAKDDALLDYFKITNQFYEKYHKESNANVIIDIHRNNYMFRRNNFGLQLVIIDPFASFGGVT